MVTTPYPYLQEYFDFLHRNPCAGDYYLCASEHADYTCLVYDTNDKYLMQSQDNPHVYLRGQKAARWWQLLAQRGLLPAPASPVAALAAETIDPAPAGEPRAQADNAPTRWRSVTLEAEAENALFEYLKQQLDGENPTQELRCQNLSELHQLAEPFVQTLNDRIERGVKEELAIRLTDEVEPATLLARCNARLTEYDLIGWQATGRVREFPFIDGVTVSYVQQQHLRPFHFAGIWVELPPSEKTALPVQFGFTDNRQQVVAARNAEQSQRLTADWCLEQGYRQLQLDPALRQVVEAYGAVDAGHPRRRWLSSLQLKLNLIACLHSELSPEEVASCYLPVEDEVELPF